VKSPFRRRKRLKQSRTVKPRQAEPEVVDWPSEGTGRSSLMSAIRGDAEKGAGFGAGMFEDLAAAFEGSKKIKIEEQQAQKTRRQDDHHVAGSGRPDLESGVIRIRRPQDEDPIQPA